MRPGTRGLRWNWRRRGTAITRRRLWTRRRSWNWRRGGPAITRRRLWTRRRSWKCWRVGPQRVLRGTNRFGARKLGTKWLGLPCARRLGAAGRDWDRGRSLNRFDFRRGSRGFCAPRVFFTGYQMFSIIGAILKTVGELLLTFWTDFHSSLTSDGEY